MVVEGSHRSHKIPWQHDQGKPTLHYLYYTSNIHFILKLSFSIFPLCKIPVTLYQLMFIFCISRNSLPSMYQQKGVRGLLLFRYLKVPFVKEFSCFYESS